MSSKRYGDEKAAFLTWTFSDWQMPRTECKKASFTFFTDYSLLCCSRKSSKFAQNKIGIGQSHAEAYCNIMSKASVNVEFGKRLAELRHKKGLSQEALAYKCGVDRTYIGIVERGEKSPTLNVLSKIAGALELTLKELFDYE